MEIKRAKWLNEEQSMLQVVVEIIETAEGGNRITVTRFLSVPRVEDMNGNPQNRHWAKLKKAVADGKVTIGPFVPRVEPPDAEWKSESNVKTFKTLVLWLANKQGIPTKRAREELKTIYDRL